MRGVRQKNMVTIVFIGPLILLAGFVFVVWAFFSSSRLPLVLIAVCSVAAAILSAHSFYTRYYLWRDQFNELGRCYDPDGSGQVYTDGAGFVWAFLGSLALLLAISSISALASRRQRKTAHESA